MAKQAVAAMSDSKKKWVFIVLGGSCCWLEVYSARIG
jgi:hypothetical protein